MSAIGFVAGVVSAFFAIGIAVGVISVIALGAIKGRRGPSGLARTDRPPASRPGPGDDDKDDEGDGPPRWPGG